MPLARKNSLDAAPRIVADANFTWQRMKACFCFFPANEVSQRNSRPRGGSIASTRGDFDARRTPAHSVNGAHGNLDSRIPRFSRFLANIG